MAGSSPTTRQHKPVPPVRRQRTPRLSRTSRAPSAILTRTSSFLLTRFSGPRTYKSEYPVLRRQASSSIHIENGVGVHCSYQVAPQQPSRSQCGLFVESRGNRGRPRSLTSARAQKAWVGVRCWESSSGKRPEPMTRASGRIERGVRLAECSPQSDSAKPCDRGHGVIIKQDQLRTRNWFGAIQAMLP